VKPIIIAPSLLAADPMRFGEDLADVEQAGADWHHVDVMDGHFVPNLTYGLPFVRALKARSKIPLDVHIMVSNPDAVVLDYVKAGADILVFPIESAVHPHRLLQVIHAAGAKAGVAVNPGTPIEMVYPLLDDLDIVNVMSVNPGFGGQKFIPQAVQRVEVLYNAAQRRGVEKKLLIEVDGGVNNETAALVCAAGATVLVAGTHIYGTKDRSGVINKLRSVAAGKHRQ
jgi:ribulose-phosphate 3-epimerase